MTPIQQFLISMDLEKPYPIPDKLFDEVWNYLEKNDDKNYVYYLTDDCEIIKYLR